MNAPPSSWASRFAFITAACLVSCAAQSATGHLHGSIKPDLPEAPEKAAVQKYCTACHAIGRIQHAGGTPAGWQDRIVRMQRWGAKIPPGEVPAVARYLASALPPRPRPADSVAYFANLAVQEVREQDIQVTLRFAAHVTAPYETELRAMSTSDSILMAAGQRARVFLPGSRGSPVPGVISTVRSGGTPGATIRLFRPLCMSRLAVAEITLSRGRHLAVANDAILTEGNETRVFVATESGDYVIRDVTLGFAGDQATQVSAGLVAGDKVVTLGAFFVDAEQRLGR